MPSTFSAVKRTGGLRPLDEEGRDALRDVREGETVRVVLTKASKRSVRHHNKLFALLKVAGDAVGWNKDQMLTWVKVATGHADCLNSARWGKDLFLWHPRSISFASMSQAEFNIFFERAVDAILTRLLPEGTSREAFLDEVHGAINERYAP